NSSTNSTQNMKQIRDLYEKDNPFIRPFILYKSDKLCLARIDRLK
ncbi:18886_t:CDS:1, partial [Funneliformis geosporum]